MFSLHKILKTIFCFSIYRLGNEKYKSKNSYRARWLEQFDLHLFDDDQMLEIIVYGRYNPYGKCTIDLRSLPRERTHSFWTPLEDCSGEIFLMLTISGTTASETITDLTSYREDPKEKENTESRYVSRKMINDVDFWHLFSLFFIFFLIYINWMFLCRLILIMGFILNNQWSTFFYINLVKWYQQYFHEFKLFMVILNWNTWFFYLSWVYPRLNWRFG